MGVTNIPTAPPGTKNHLDFAGFARIRLYPELGREQ